ncbi:MAG: hypothetical protein HQL20_10220 [Candidatus Omnitrophica bacterium]|nr:hypothetical protein [Candidatus Omnitrophota bacterium]
MVLSQVLVGQSANDRRIFDEDYPVSVDELLFHTGGRSRNVEDVRRFVQLEIEERFTQEQARKMLRGAIFRRLDFNMHGVRSRGIVWGEYFRDQLDDINRPYDEYRVAIAQERVLPAEMHVLALRAMERGLRARSVADPERIVAALDAEGYFSLMISELDRRKEILTRVCQRLGLIDEIKQIIGRVCDPLDRDGVLMAYNQGVVENLISMEKDTIYEDLRLNRRNWNEVLVQSTAGEFAEEIKRTMLQNDPGLQSADLVILGGRVTELLNSFLVRAHAVEQLVEAQYIANSAWFNEWQRQKQAEDLNKLEMAIAQASDPYNPSFADLVDVLEENSQYVVEFGEKGKYRTGTEFIPSRICRMDRFLDNVLTAHLRALPPEQYQVVRGLLEIQFKARSGPRRVELLNDLMEGFKRSLSNGNQQAPNKGELFFNMVPALGIPIVKLVQLLAQRDAFVGLGGANEEEGKAINKRMRDVQGMEHGLPKTLSDRALIRAGFREKLEYLQDSFGSASINDVRLVTFREPIVVDGVEYSSGVVRVKKPGALKNLPSDEVLTLKMAAYLRSRYPKVVPSDDYFRRHFADIRSQLDTRAAVTTTNGFAERLAARGSLVRVPKVLYQDDNLMIIEHLPGKTLDKVSDLSSRRISPGAKITDEFLSQVFYDGVWHRDLTQRNSLATRNSVAMIDFDGYGQENDPARRQALFSIFRSLLLPSMGKKSQDRRQAALGQALTAFGFTVGEGKNITPDDISTVFQDNNVEERFQALFFLVDKRAGKTVPESLPAFLDGVAKVGPNAKNLSVLDKAWLVSRWGKFLLTPPQAPEEASADKSEKGGIDLGLTQVVTEGSLRNDPAAQEAWRDSIDHAGGLDPVIIELKRIPDPAAFLQFI